MYLPRKFREDRIEVLHAAMLEIGAAAIVGHGPGGQGPDGPIASHVPIELDPEPAPGALFVATSSDPIPTPKALPTAKPT